MEVTKELKQIESVNLYLILPFCNKLLNGVLFWRIFYFIYIQYMVLKFGRYIYTAYINNSV